MYFVLSVFCYLVIPLVRYACRYLFRMVISLFLYCLIVFGRRFVRSAFLSFLLYFWSS